jgi:hypothetical protein
MVNVHIDVELLPGTKWTGVILPVIKIGVERSTGRVSSDTLGREAMQHSLDERNTIWYGSRDIVTAEAARFG